MPSSFSLPASAAEAISAAVREAGVSVSEAARRCGIPRSSFTGYLTGRTDPKYGRVVEILGALGAARPHPGVELRRAHHAVAAVFEEFGAYDTVVLGAEGGPGEGLVVITDFEAPYPDTAWIGNRVTDALGGIPVTVRERAVLTDAELAVAARDGKKFYADAELVRESS